MKPCPSCKADKAKPRTGSLGEPKGVWCTACGHSTDTVEAWEEGADRLGPFTFIPNPDEPTQRSVYYGRYLLNTISGADLDEMAWRAYGLSRTLGETDGALRDRVYVTPPVPWPGRPLGASRI